jgi:leucine-rich repeat protein SHOC2
MKNILSILLLVLTNWSIAQEIVPERPENNEHELDEQLKRNYVSLSNIKAVPARVFDARELVSLVIYVSDSLKEVSPRIRELKKLRNLQITNTALDKFPVGICELENLEELTFGINFVTEIPSAISQLKKMKVLKLESLILKKIPAEIGQLKNLEELAIWGSKANYYRNGKLMSSEGVKTIPAEIGQLSNLKKLSLYDNGLVSLPASIGDLDSLSYLALIRNDLRELPPEIGGMKNLRILELSENKLEKLPDEIVELTNLAGLNLENNKLTHLPKNLGRLKNLKGLFVKGNNIPEEELRQLKKEMPGTVIHNGKYIQ